MGSRTVTHLTREDPDEPGTYVAFGDPIITDTRDLQDARNEALARLAQHFDELVSVGRNYGGLNFQIDAASLQNINGASSMAMVAQAAGGGWPAGFFWVASDNAQMPVDAGGMIAFGMNVGLYYSALVLTNRALKNAIGGLSAIAACDAFDVTQGWPSN